MFFLFVSFLACVNSKEPVECITYYDTCNAACDLQCGSTADKEAIEREGVCDLGCIEDTGSEIAECILVEDTCQWADE